MAMKPEYETKGNKNENRRDEISQKILTYFRT